MPVIKWFLSPLVRTTLNGRKTSCSAFVQPDFRASSTLLLVLALTLDPIHRDERMLDFDQTCKLLKNPISEWIMFFLFVCLLYLFIFFIIKHFYSHSSTCFPMMQEIKRYYDIFTHISKRAWLLFEKMTSLSRQAFSSLRNHPIYHSIRG